MTTDTTREARVLEAYQDHPEWTVSRIGRELGIGNPHYYMRKLAREGKLKLREYSEKMKQTVATRKAREAERGIGKLPNLSDERQAELIEQVVRKAKKKAEGKMQFADHDVIRINLSPWGVRGRKVS